MGFHHPILGVLKHVVHEYLFNQRNGQREDRPFSRVFPLRKTTVGHVTQPMKSPGGIRQGSSPHSTNCADSGVQPVRKPRAGLFQQRWRLLSISIVQNSMTTQTETRATCPLEQTVTCDVTERLRAGQEGQRSSEGQGATEITGA